MENNNNKQEKISKTKKLNLQVVLVPLLIILMALVFASLLILLVGKSPTLAFTALVKGSLGNKSAIIYTINKAVPICICSFAVAFSYFGGVFNIGVEGQLQIGALFAVVAGYFFKGLPPIIHIPVTLLFGALGGMIWSLVPAVLHIERKVNIIVLCLFMNYIAEFLLQYFIYGPLKSAQSLIPATYEIAESAKIPNMIDGAHKLSYAFIIVIILAVILQIYFKKTYSGYELKMTGKNPEAAYFFGLKTKKYLYLSILVAGLLGGIAGAVEIQGRYYRIIDGFASGAGFDGITIALLANGNTFGMIIGSFIFGAIRAGATNMQMLAGVPSQIIQAVQGFLMLAIAVQRIFPQFIKVFKNRKDAKRSVDNV